MFRILEPIELQGWREQSMDMPLVTQRYCPCDGTELRTVAAVVGMDPRVAGSIDSAGNFTKDHSETSEIRVGCCPGCGYMGYIDRPTAEWFQKFYASGWDQRTEAYVQLAIDERRQEGIQIPPNPLVEVAKRIPFQPEARVFEAGTGYGDAIESMRRIGYRNVSGIEPCPHRAKVAREGWGLDVRHESTEGHKGGPYDIVLSCHVLEHCYDPTAIMRKLSSLQPEGGYLVLGVPNNAGEPTMGVLLFLPHLHSFTTKGLRWLLQDAGYTVLDTAGTSNEDQWVIARKTADASERKFHPVRHWEDCFWAGEHKLRKGLTSGYSGEFFQWNISKDNGWLNTKHGAEMDYDEKQRPPRCLRVEPLRERRTNAPIEIQWEGPLRLFVK